MPIINAKLDLIDEDIQDLKYDLEEAKRHNQSKVASIEKKIQKFKDEINDIKNSAKVAKISIEKQFNGLNTIIFELLNGDEIVYKTEPITYQPFHLEFNENSVTLLPVSKTISLD